MLYNSVTYFIPIFDIESEIDVKVLVMVVVKDAGRLPRLPPVSLEIDPRMVDDAVVVNVGQQDGHGDCGVTTRKKKMRKLD